MKYIKDWLSIGGYLICIILDFCEKLEKLALKPQKKLKKGARTKLDTQFFFKLKKQFKPKFLILAFHTKWILYIFLCLELLKTYLCVFGVRIVQVYYCNPVE